jgi:hypothetical protein
MNCARFIHLHRSVARPEQVTLSETSEFGIDETGKASYTQLIHLHRIAGLEPKRVTDKS